MNYTAKGTINLETRRLLLRRFNKDDALDMYNNWASDQEVTKYLTWDVHQTINDTNVIINKWLAEYQDVNRYEWAIYLKESQEVIGSIGLFNIINDTIEVGYCLSKKYWHQGITSEALNCIISFVFDELNLNILIAKHVINNYRSGLVMKKCGMQYVKSSKKSIKNTDLLMMNYVLTRNQYQVNQLRTKLMELSSELIIPIFDNFENLYHYCENCNIYGKKIILLGLDNLIEISHFNDFVYYINKFENYQIIYLFSTRDNQAQLDLIYQQLITKYHNNYIGSFFGEMEMQIIESLRSKKETIATAESCTGGAIISKLIDIPNASKVINESYVVYSNDAKHNLLGVKVDLINKYTAYSNEVTEEMAEGLKRITNCNLCIGVSGLAGGHKNKDNGLLYYTINYNGRIYNGTKRFFGTRKEVKNLQAIWVIKEVLKILQNK